MKFLVSILTILFCVPAMAQEVFVIENPTVLLVSGSIQQADILAAAAGDDVLVIQYEPESTNLNVLLLTIREKLAGRKSASIGIAAHDYGEARFYLTGEHTISLGSTLNSSEQRKFWQELGGLIVEEGRIDLFACNLAKADQGKMLISALEELCGVTVAASANETGNPAKGGDWVLETADIDVGYVYFRADRLQSFSGLLWGERKKILPDDGATDDYFGDSVSISGDYAIVGAYNDDDSGFNSGAAYIFARNQGGADNWGQVQKLLAADGAAYDYFGFCVSISGDYAIVGAYHDDDNGSISGSAYIYSRNQGGSDNWGQVQKLLAADGAVEDFFGWRVSISGDYAIVGAHRDDDNGINSGSAYIYSRNQGGADNWGQVKKLLAADGAVDDYFGYSVSISGDYAIVGAYQDDDNGSNSGSAYIYSRNQGGADNWGQVKKLLAADGAAYDFFGYSVSISGDYAIVGAIGDDDNGSFSGSAYIYSRNQGGAENWGQAKKLLAADGAVLDYFGESVSISGDYAIVGACRDDDNGSDSGSAYIFAKNQGGADNWGQVQKLTASDAAALDSFGESISISDEYAIVGAFGDEDNGTFSGSAYTFQITFEVAVPTVINGTTDKDGTNVFFSGESITITAIPQPGYYLSGWTGDASGSANPLTIDPVNSDMTITPVFALQTGTLIVNITANGSGGNFTISGPPAFNGGNSLIGQTGNYSQTVPTGTYSVTFSQATGYGVSLTSTSFNVSGNMASGVLGANATETITGTYTQGQYSVYVNGANGGSTNHDGSNTVNHGGSFSVTASANPGYTFTGWTGDIISNDNPLTISNITSDLNISPNFSQGTATLNVTISAGASGGTYSIAGPANFNGGNLLSGQTAAFSSTVPVGTYVITYTNIVGWGVSLNASGLNVTGNIATGELTAGADVSVTGSYTQGQYTVSVSTVAGGSTDHDGANVVTHGSNLTITATATGDYKFFGWSGDVATTDNPLVLTNITRDYTVTPVFEGLPGKGNLKVTLLGTKLGRWRLTGETVWRSSGVTILNLPTGEHTIVCKTVKGFHTPERRLVLISKNQTNYTVLTYVLLLSKPKVHYFTATPDEVEPGGVVTLEWEVEGADSFSINNGTSDHKDKKGSELVRVDSDTTFELTANNTDGSSKASTEVSVSSGLEILQFGCSHGDGKPLYPGDVARLCWVVVGAERVFIENKLTGESFVLAPTGALDVAPDESTTFQITAYNSTSNKKAELNIEVSDAVNINSFSANCLNIYKGNKVRLTWDVQGADSVEVIPGVGHVAAIGSAEVVITANTAFTLKADSVEKTLNITAVNEAPDLLVSFNQIKNRKGNKLVKPAIGQVSIVQAKISNMGGAACSSILVRLLSQNRIIDEVVIDGLAAGASKTLGLHWLPRTPGRHKLEIIADPEDLISETNEANNSSKKKVRVAGIGGVDLVIDDLKVEPGAEGKTLKISYIIHNLGTEKSASFQYQLFLTKGAKQTIKKALVLVADDYLDSMAPGESVAVTKVVELKKIPKRLYLQAKVDIHNAIAEANEENNHIVRKVK